MAKASPSTTDASPPIRLTLVAPAGPNLAHHTACAINNVIYLHGGIEKKGSTQPSDKIYAMDLESRIWQEVKAADSPALSHHACVVMEDRYIVLIGGWNGKVRSCDIHTFDTQEKQWKRLTTDGFNTGAGLSSHTATLLTSGDILVIGREGSARLQRRYGNGWLLQGNLSKGNFIYKEITFDFDSRSGHTTHPMSAKVVTLGGRNDRLIQVLTDYRPVPMKCPLMSKFAKLTERLTPMKKPPCGRKNHIGISGSGVILFHGGDTFDGKCREPVGEVFMLTFKPSIQWYKLINTTVGRSGHALAYTDGEIYFHGGEGGKNTVHADLYRIEVNS